MELGEEYDIVEYFKGLLENGKKLPSAMHLQLIFYVKYHAPYLLQSPPSSSSSMWRYVCPRGCHEIRFSYDYLGYFKMNTNRDKP